MSFPCLLALDKGRGGERMQPEGGSEKIVARLFHEYGYNKVS